MTPRRRFLGIFCLALAAYAFSTHDRPFAAGNDLSRWAQIEALVDYRSGTIERSRFAATVDRLEAGGHVYSNKPPFLAIVGAGLYAPLEAATGWRLGDRRTSAAAVWVLTLLLVGAPAALGVALFDRLLARFPGLSPGGRLLCDLALAGGTLVGSYAGTLNNHVPAAALLIAAGAAVLADRPAIAGAACGFAAAVDLLPGLGMTPFFAWMLVAGRGRIRTRWLRFAVGLTPGLAAALLSDLLVTGTLLPPKLLPGAVDLSVRAGASVAGVLLPESRLYPLEVLGGWHGLFLVSPVLVVGALGLWRAATRPPFASPWLWRALGIGIVAQIVGHALLAGSYGGWAFGFRYLIPVQPLLLFGAPVVLAADWGRKLFALLLPPSLLFAAIGAYNPWPPAYEQRTGGDAVASLVHDPIAGNAAAWCCEHWPGSRLCQGVGERFIAADPGMRRRYLELFFASKGDVEALEALERR